MLTTLLLALLITIAGYVIGLGAVTVMDIHGFLGRKSAYWTEATTRTHKVTKPLIWLGTILTLSGGVYLYNALGELNLLLFHVIAFILLISNGIFLSFSVSPFLIARAKEGRSAELLPSSWQAKITASLIVSFLGWWSTLVLLLWTLSLRIPVN